MASICPEATGVTVLPGVLTFDRKHVVTALESPQARRQLKHLLPFFECVRDFACSLMLVYQGQHPHDVPAAPWIVVLGDDNFAGAFGPSSFDGESLDRLICEADHVVLIDSGPEPYAYNTAATAAAKYRKNAVVIETLPEVSDAWHDRIMAIKPGVGLLWSRALETI